MRDKNTHRVTFLEDFTYNYYGEKTIKAGTVHLANINFGREMPDENTYVLVCGHGVYFRIPKSSYKIEPIADPRYSETSDPD